MKASPTVVVTEVVEVLVVEPVVDVADEVDVVDVLVVAGAVYSNVVVEVAPEESVAVMTYVPVTHNGVPPTCVA